jgi:hypothetical protein
MATWRQALEVVMTDEEVARLTALSRSRTEPASRVQRAQMLLAYRENRSFFAVGQRVGASLSLHTPAFATQQLAACANRLISPRPRRTLGLYMETR